jgi:hypothetical protein
MPPFKNVKTARVQIEVTPMMTAWDLLHCVAQQWAPKMRHLRVRAVRLTAPPYAINVYLELPTKADVRRLFL